MQIYLLNISIIIKNCDNILLAQSIPYKEENKLPLYGRPLQRLLIVNAAGPQALTATCSLQAIHIPYMISHFAYLHPFITMSFVVVGGLVLIYSFSKYHNKDAEKITIKSKVKETMKDEACWSVTRKNDRDIYQSLSNDEDFSQFAKVSVEKETNDFKNTLALYHRLLDKNNYNLHASKMKRITREDLQGKKLVVDIGGEGFVHDIGIRVAGVIHALNLNGHVRNNVTGFPIPFLIKINDWDTEDFPFEDGIVDAFIMQATPPPTLKTSNEIIRCMNKETGRVDLILNELNNEIMMCYQYIRNGLGFKLYQGEEMVRKEYPHLVGSEYLTIYSSKYKPTRLSEISIL